MREQIIFQIIDLLEKKGFLVSSYLHSNNCFDIAAKKDNQLLLLKVFGVHFSKKSVQKKRFLKVLFFLHQPF